MKRKLSVNYLGFESKRWVDALVSDFIRRKKYLSYEDVWSKKRVAIHFAACLKALRIAYFDIEQEDCD